ncbi:hypothetical protein K8354_07650 [Polaribacter litorisediminis]|uniref:hypothetical protein n=1 Tax=Polaribacter litorisediminis TaxID=1908341 RepID=UPI001CBE955C|nr:hypothetical protein [Polaribacter litorisediminis]UAM99670.1 hypothetical protein K8354_07650 [Polaribacter litorisediminis]
MKKNMLLWFVFISLNSLGQKKIHPLETENNYVKLSIYKKISSEKLTKKDSANFKFIKGDTLVFVKNLKKLIRKSSRNKNASLMHASRAYMPLHQYKKRHSEIITKQDSLNFRLKDKDTLILISNKKFYQNKQGVSIPYEPKGDEFLKVYTDIVYKKYQNTNNTNQKTREYMRLWKKLIKIYFAPGLHSYYKKAIQQEVKKLSSIDSLQILYTKNIKESNYIIYQINDENSTRYSKEIKGNNALDYYLFWNNGRIYDAKLAINLKNTDEDKKIIGNHLIQYFYQTLGRFFTTSTLPCKSIFSSCTSDSKQLTKQDLELLKYHYSYGICKFTDLKTFEENHAKAKEVLKNGGQMLFTHLD